MYHHGSVVFLQCEFCEICLLPSDGGLVEPRPAEFEDFYHTLSVGDEKGVSSVTATSLHFPAVHYFALFIAKCLLAREKVGALSALDLAVLHRALEGDTTYSLGAIVAHRLHINKCKDKIHGGIYATRFNIQIRQHDYPLTKVHLDHAAIEHHQFIAGNYPNIPIPYNLVFSVNTRDIIPLPAPALFYPIATGGYKIMPTDIVAYRNNLAAEPQQWDPQVPSTTHFDMGPHGFFDY